MMRTALALVLLVGCLPRTASPVTQHGLVAAPRPASYDGQPMTTSSRVEGHFSSARMRGLDGVPDSGAAVARHQAGGAIRVALGPNADLGVEADAAWQASENTLGGDNSVSSGVPEAAVLDGAVAFRVSSGRGPARVGFAVAVGMTSIPIHREGQPGARYSRDETAVARAAVVPSYRMDNITLYASFGGASQSEVKETFSWYPDEAGAKDPGVIAEVGAFVLTAAAGATLDLGSAHLTAQVGDAIGDGTHFGPQVMAGLAFDLGAPVRPASPR